MHNNAALVEVPAPAPILPAKAILAGKGVAAPFQMLIKFCLEARNIVGVDQRSHGIDLPGYIAWLIAALP